MSEQEPGMHWGWEEFFNRNDWDAVDEWWRNWFLENPDDPQALGDLLAALRTKVPVIRVANGIERYERHIQCDDAPSEWRRELEPLRGAARILDAGELEAAAEGVPEPSLVKWHALEALVRERLQPFLEAPEVTNGADEFSRRAHTLAAFEMLDSIRSTSKWMAAEMNSDHDAAWIREVISEIALLAFGSGRHAQAAWGKEFEKLAVDHEPIARAFEANGRAGREANNANRVNNAGEWHQHARKVEAQSTGRLKTKSARAAYIYRNWKSVGTEGSPPERPAEGTIRNFLSSQK